MKFFNSFLQKSCVGSHNRMQTYTRRMVLPVDEVIWHINQRIEAESMYGANLPLRSEINGFQVGLTSIRLRTFARDASNLRCAHCGLEGKFFSIDSHQKQLTYTHLNLFAINDKGEEVLMTCDHILARGLGGEDDLSNTQVLCSRCNAVKSKQESLISNKIRRQLDILMKSVKICNTLHNDAARELLEKWKLIMNDPSRYPSDNPCKRLTATS